MANSFYSNPYAPSYYQYPYAGYNSYQQPQQSYNQNTKFMEWVEGEVGAKAFQMPVGCPANTPIPLWDSTSQKIYLKSWNQMGKANELVELPYEIKGPQNMFMLPENTSGKDMSQYVTRQDFDELKDEIKNLSAMMSKTSSNKTRGEI